MFRFFISCICIWVILIPSLQGQHVRLKSPDEFLPYKHGTRFTPHHLLVEYCRHVDEASEKVNLIEYGKTYELRPLIACIISSPQNMKRIEDIRQNNLKRTGMMPGDALPEDIAIVHLSYSIHGNEAAGSESSMAVIHALAKGGTGIDTWLANTIVIIDPSLNPDGYSRYSHWNNSVSGAPFNASPDTREHDEPWPGGRTNHYYFDLNRDWAWLTQQESRDRVAFYLKWMPHVHADLHEMFGESSYFFAPAAQPYLPYLTSWQSEFQVDIGKNHASYFDKEGWRYFTKEYFDLFYPSYGDTYPMLSGAIGMTYEQSGHAFAGRALLVNNGDTLKLSDRIAHHYTTSLSTIEVASKNASRLVKEFGQYYKNAISNPAGSFKYYVIKNSNHAGRIIDLISLLDQQGIQYGVINRETKAIKGFSYFARGQVTFTPEAGDMVIPTSQPRSALLNALFEPEAALADSLTYDITAWSVPMAYGLSTFATSESLAFIPYFPVTVPKINFNSKPYAYAIEWGSVPSTKLLASIISEGIVARYAAEDFKVNGVEYKAGTIVILRADNRQRSGFDDIIRKKFTNAVVPVSSISTGFVESGKDLGSDSYALVRKPNVLSIAGDGVSSQSIGQVWHFFEEELNYPIHLVEPDQINNVALNKYNVLILPEGFYNLDNDFLQKLSAWTRSGGQVIAIGSGIRQLSGKDGFAIKSKSKPTEEKPIEEDPAHYPEAYNSFLRKSISSDIGGAVFQTVKDETNPLTYGLGESYWTLKTSTSAYAWLPAGANAIYLDDKPNYYGFAGSKALEKINKTLVAGREPSGAGGIVYLVDNPLFRSFWNSGKVLFSNALFF